MKTYKGINLENLDKSIQMAHSRFFEKNTGIEYLEKLLGYDKAKITAQQFHQASALSSVANMNYQICNGGIYQYFDNCYHEERAPFNEQDVKQLDKEEQTKMLCELLAFGNEIFPEKKLENQNLKRTISEFEEAFYEEPTLSWDDEDYDEYDTGIYAPYFFDEHYYEVNGYIETLIEAYAQYLYKKFEQEGVA